MNYCGLWGYVRREKERERDIYRESETETQRHRERGRQRESTLQVKHTVNILPMILILRIYLRKRKT